MRKMMCGLLLATVALATPAAARDGGFYLGVEGGMFDIGPVKSVGPDFGGGGFPPLLVPSAAQSPAATSPTQERVKGSFDTGIDADIVAGYDWGWVRTEAEFGWKRASFDDVTVRNSLIPFILDGTHDTKGKARIFSGVANVLLDIPVADKFNAYVGPGIGYGTLKLTPKVDLFDNGEFGDELKTTKRSGVMGQIVAGARYSVTDTVDFGLKYRYIRSEKLKYDAGILGDLKGRLETYSVLASVVYNFGGRSKAAPAPAATAAE